VFAPQACKNSALLTNKKNKAWRTFISLPRPKQNRLAGFKK